MRKTTAERFWEKVDFKGPLLSPYLGPCWLWTGGTLRGYGNFCTDGSRYRAHGFSFELMRGPIPATLVLDHLCRIKECVNPAHLEAVTQRTNVLRGDGITAKQARQTHCKRGHEFTFENTYWNAGRRRVCRACKRIAKRNARQLEKANRPLAEPVSTDGREH